MLLLLLLDNCKFFADQIAEVAYATYKLAAEA